MKRFGLWLAAASVLGGVAMGQRVLIAQPGGPGGPPAGPGGNPAGPAGLHVPNGQRINFNYNMTDGGGFLWDLQYYGTIGQGTNYAYGGGMYCQVNNCGIQPRGQGWANKAGDEVEIGPFSHNSPVRIYRRIRVYKDQPLARWLDIFENPSAQDQTLQVQIYTNTNYTISQTTTSSGGTTFGEKDWAFLTRTSGGANTPAVLSIVCDVRSKIRPSVQVQSNNISIRYNLTVPANKTLVLCTFQSQGHNQAQHDKMLKGFRSYRMLKDLPPSVQKLVVNFQCSRGIEGVDLERSESEDNVLLKRGDTILGKVNNVQFDLQTLFGPLTLKPEDVIGMVAGLGEDDHVRFVLGSGQVVRGQGKDIRLSVALAGGGSLEIPASDIAQWSFRISPGKPAEQPFAGPAVLLRTGDRLAFDPQKLQLSFRTRYGLAALDGKDLLEILLDNPGNTVHRCVFLNGTRLGGFLEPANISLALKLGAKLDIPRDLLAQVKLGQDESRPPGLTQVIMNNEDELLGRFIDKSFKLITKYNTVDLTLDHVKAMKLEEGELAVEMWNGTVHRGLPAQGEMSFEVTPRTVLKLPTSQIVSVVRPDPVPPAEIRKQVEDLAARLGAESFKERQEATDKLLQMGKGVAPLLQRLADSPDAEVRHRIQEILDRLGVGDSPKSDNPNAPGVFFQGVMQRGG